MRDVLTRINVRMRRDRRRSRLDAIDYDRAARAYREGRTLPAAVMESWRRAIGTVPLTTGGRVLDVGAGTGQFLDALARWLNASVIGVEPSGGMRAEARRHAVPGSVAVVAGRAEALPLSNAAVDIAWLSAVVHQIDDLDRAVGELFRVVRPGGRVLIRGYFGDRPLTGLLTHFPGIDRVAGTFPTTAAVSEVFSRRGFALNTIRDVSETWSFEVAAWIEQFRALRHVDSALRPLSDDEFEAGIAATERAHRHETGLVVSETSLSLMVLST